MQNDRPPTPAVFIDRDGTLIEEVNFLFRVEDLRIFDYTVDAVQMLKEHGYLVIVLTNQSGIGRKIFTESDMHAVHREIQKELNFGIAAFYFCPHLPDENCACRKPNIGMIESALADFEIDMKKSWMIGDKKLDVETGFNAGVKTAMVLTGYGEEDSKTLKRKPNVLASNLLEAAKAICENSAK